MVQTTLDSFLQLQGSRATTAVAPQHANAAAATTGQGPSKTTSVPSDLENNTGESAKDDTTSDAIDARSSRLEKARRRRARKRLLKAQRAQDRPPAWYVRVSALARRRGRERDEARKYSDYFDQSEGIRELKDEVEGRDFNADLSELDEDDVRRLQEEETPKWLSDAADAEDWEEEDLYYGLWHKRNKWKELRAEKKARRQLERGKEVEFGAVVMSFEGGGKRGKKAPLNIDYDSARFHLFSSDYVRNFYQNGYSYVTIDFEEDGPDRYIGVVTLAAIDSYFRFGPFRPSEFARHERLVFKSTLHHIGEEYPVGLEFFGDRHLKVTVPLALLLPDHSRRHPPANAPNYYEFVGFLG